VFLETDGNSCGLYAHCGTIAADNTASAKAIEMKTDLTGTTFAAPIDAILDGYWVRIIDYISLVVGTGTAGSYQYVFYCSADADVKFKVVIHGAQDGVDDLSFRVDSDSFQNWDVGNKIDQFQLSTESPTVSVLAGAHKLMVKGLATGYSIRGTMITSDFDKCTFPVSDPNWITIAAMGVSYTACDHELVGMGPAHCKSVALGEDFGGFTFDGHTCCFKRLPLLQLARMMSPDPLLILYMYSVTATLKREVKTDAVPGTTDSDLWTLRGQDNELVATAEGGTTSVPFTGWTVHAPMSMCTRETYAPTVDTKCGGTGVGGCGAANALLIGSDSTSVGTDISTRDIALERCGARCDLDNKCGGFSFEKGTVAMDGSHVDRCWYKLSVSCYSEAALECDCYRKVPVALAYELAAPGDRCATSLTESECASISGKTLSIIAAADYTLRPSGCFDDSLDVSGTAVFWNPSPSGGNTNDQYKAYCKTDSGQTLAIKFSSDAAHACTWLTAPMTTIEGATMYQCQDVTYCSTEGCCATRGSPLMRCPQGMTMCTDMNCAQD
jgi:hypothetical protein